MGKQVLDIEPKNEIYFRGPYSQTVTEYFKITNPTDRRIAFKVKTTAPKRYCVRPSNGVLSPNATESIAVILQPYEGGIRIDKSIHKFMIQSVYAPEGNFNHEDLFKSASPAEIMDSKFKCVFDDGPNTTGATAGVTNGDHGGAVLVSGDDFATRTEPKVQRVTIKENQQSGAAGAAAARLSSMKASTAGDDHTLPGYDTATAGSTLNEAHDEFVGDSAAATGGVYGEAVAKDLSHDDVKRLHDQIQRLKEKLKESEQQRSQHYVPSHSSSHLSSSQSQLDSNLYVQLIVVSIAIFVGILVGRLF